MKTSTKPFSRKGFTLIELLVVMAIIATLVGAGFMVGPTMMNRAKKLSSQAGATAIAMAVEQFYTEYSALPDPTVTPTAVDTEYSTADTDANGIILLNILAGTVLTGTAGDDQNPRKMRFLTAKEAKNGIDGIEYGAGGDSIVGMYDAWGEPFYVILDYDYDERLKFTPKITPVPPEVTPEVELNGRRVAVYSLGVKNASDANANTLVKSW